MRPSHYTPQHLIQQILTDLPATNRAAQVDPCAGTAHFTAAAQSVLTQGEERGARDA
jgi:type I restriction-modification system DNA methylase subunit